MIVVRVAAAVCAAVCGAALVAGCVGDGTTPPAPPSTAPNVVARLEQALAPLERQGFRGVVEVRRDDRVLVSRAFGPADVAAGRPNTPATRFRVASVTKQFTAVGILLLQEQGRLKATDAACAHLPACPPAWSAVTIEQLITHTAGVVRNVVDTPQERAALLATRPSHLDLAARILARPLGAPGTWAYSNAGYDLLGAVIEHVSGRTYGAFLRASVLDPLGMGDSGIDWPAAEPSTRAVGYVGPATPAPSVDDEFQAAGALYATTGDLARWNTFLLTGTPPLLTPATRDLVLAPTVPVPGMSVRYGYGVQTWRDGKDLAIEHNGGMPGFRTYNGIHPGTRTSVTVVTNLDTFDPSTSGHTLMDIAVRYD
ncbi:serine hydrolase domain-containing protein [Actinosynnema sp. NPDC047251]|uniref:Putative secreted protein n=1 Tax=Saccharothrix espanaensis (strain ATCC 51144 / DSM 44229 / JCM 9112 / NBRC 15066 / NRRL 15764) TaxID=1179773 RepID=K0JT06_SACES|nr:serine hydrolase domain-containing protein [Saccharothrix espanaensis]CCH30895.1 putative secreted protein [Saccharothrix espanaensis DSM 44229]